MRQSTLSSLLGLGYIVSCSALGACKAPLRYGAIHAGFERTHSGKSMQYFSACRQPLEAADVADLAEHVRFGGACFPVKHMAFSEYN